jgi:hypothetical protein
VEFSKPVLIVHIDSNRPVLKPWLPFLEVRGKVEGLALVAIVGAPVDAERSHLHEKLHTNIGYRGKGVLAVEHVDSESVRGGEIAASQFVHLMALVVDLLAGPSEGVVCRDLLELDAAILLRLGGEDEGVNLVTGFGGEFE